MVVPNGTLFAAGVGERIKSDLLESFNLHTIVRLPKGVFAPYTGIATNLLFFEKNAPTKEIWYYELPLPSEREELKNPCYTKSKPLRYEEFKPLLRWWSNRVESECAWKISVQEVVKNNYNLDIKNPNKEKAEEYRPPEEIVVGIVEREKKILDTMKQIQVEIQKEFQNER